MIFTEWEKAPDKKAFVAAQFPTIMETLQDQSIPLSERIDRFAKMFPMANPEIVWKLNSPEGKTLFTNLWGQLKGDIPQNLPSVRKVYGVFWIVATKALERGGAPSPFWGEEDIDLLDFYSENEDIKRTLGSMFNAESMWNCDPKWIKKFQNVQGFQDRQKEVQNLLDVVSNPPDHLPGQFSFQQHCRIVSLLWDADKREQALLYFSWLFGEDKKCAFERNDILPAKKYFLFLYQQMTEEKKNAVLLMQSFLRVASFVDFWPLVFRDLLELEEWEAAAELVKKTTPKKNIDTWAEGLIENLDAPLEAPFIQYLMKNQSFRFLFLLHQKYKIGGLISLSKIFEILAATHDEQSVSGDDSYATWAAEAAAPSMAMSGDGSCASSADAAAPSMAMMGGAGSSLPTPPSTWGLEQIFDQPDRLSSLTHIADIPIGELEKRLRPGAMAKTGFLGPKESLLDVLKNDWKTVAFLRLTHAEIYRALLHLQFICIDQANGEILYQYRRYPAQRISFTKEQFLGYQEDPFGKIKKWDTHIICRNLENGIQVTLNAGIIQMIKMFGFYEGGGDANPFRIDPLRLFAFLTGVPLESLKRNLLEWIELFEPNFSEDVHK